MAKENIPPQKLWKREFHKMTAEEHSELYQEAILAAGDTVPLKSLFELDGIYFKRNAKDPILKEQLRIGIARLIERLKKDPIIFKMGSRNNRTVAYLTFPAFSKLI